MRASRIRRLTTIIYLSGSVALLGNGYLLSESLKRHSWLEAAFHLAVGIWASVIGSYLIWKDRYLGHVNVTITNEISDEQLHRQIEVWANEQRNE